MGISELKTTDDSWEAQRWLAMRGLYTGDIDGIAGQQTESAIDAFQRIENVSDGWFDLLRRRVEEMRPGRYTNEAEFLYELRKMCIHLGLSMPEQMAYIAATVKHETGGAFNPVEEGYYLGKAKAVPFQRNLRYYPFFGRGLVQLTWENNYRYYTKILRPVTEYGNTGGIDLVSNPDQANDPGLSMFILAHGFKIGAFRRNHFLERHINSSKTDFINARLCINGIPKGSNEPDKASLIAGYAKRYVKEFT